MQVSRLAYVNGADVGFTAQGRILLERRPSPEAILLSCRRSFSRTYASIDSRVQLRLVSRARQAHRRAMRRVEELGRDLRRLELRNQQFLGRRIRRMDHYRRSFFALPTSSLTDWAVSRSFSRPLPPSSRSTSPPRLQFIPPRILSTSLRLDSLPRSRLATSIQPAPSIDFRLLDNERRCISPQDQEFPKSRLFSLVRSSFPSQMVRSSAPYRIRHSWLSRIVDSRLEIDRSLSFCRVRSVSRQGRAVRTYCLMHRQHPRTCRFSTSRTALDRSCIDDEICPVEILSQVRPERSEAARNHQRCLCCWSRCIVRSADWRSPFFA